MGIIPRGSGQLFFSFSTFIAQKTAGETPLGNTEFESTADPKIVFVVCTDRHGSEIRLLNLKVRRRSHFYYYSANTI
jgi:hypothetical protein